MHCLLKKYPCPSLNKKSEVEPRPLGEITAIHEREDMWLYILLSSAFSCVFSQKKHIDPSHIPPQYFCSRNFSVRCLKWSGQRASLPSWDVRERMLSLLGWHQACSSAPVVPCVVDGCGSLTSWVLELHCLAW